MPIGPPDETPALTTKPGSMAEALEADLASAKSGLSSLYSKVVPTLESARQKLRTLLSKRHLAWQSLLARSGAGSTRPADERKPTVESSTVDESAVEKSS